MSAHAQPAPAFSMAVEKTAQESILRCTGRITMQTADQLRETARAAIDESECVVLDFAAISYLDSFGVGVIAGIWISAKNSGRKLKLMNLNPRIREIFRITRLTMILDDEV